MYGELFSRQFSSTVQSDTTLYAKGNKQQETAETLPNFSDFIGKILSLRGERGQTPKLLALILSLLFKALSGTYCS